jgi:hypothetical protein
MLWASLWLLFPSLIPSLALVPAGPVTPVLAGLITGLMASMAGMIALVLSAGFLACFLGVALIANVAACCALLGGKAPREDAPGVSGPKSVLLQTVTIVVAAVPLIGLRRMPVDWDARSIWLFHARWFFAGGRFLEQALENPAFVFSHPDYPPAIPATVGGLWTLLGKIDLPAGQAVIGMLNLCAVSLLALGFVHLARPKQAAVGAGIAVMAALGAFGMAGASGVNGYADLLWAASAAAGALYLLIAPPGRSQLILGLVSVAVAGLTKNEGFAAALLILFLAALRHRSSLRMTAAICGSGVALLVWPVLSRVSGAVSDLKPAQILSGWGPSVRHLSQVGDHALPLIVPVGIPAAVCTLIGCLFLRTKRKEGSLGSAWWSWAAVAGMSMSVALAYLASPHDVSWHLNTSINRTTLGIRMLLFTELLTWCLVAVNALFGGPSVAIARNGVGPRADVPVSL